MILPDGAKQPGRPRVAVDLFLNTINQEMIQTTDMSCDFYASWTKSCCILDFSRVRPGEDLVQPPEMRGLLFRKEPEGGMMWDPASGAVYKLSEHAYHALIDLDQGLSDVQVARRNGLSMDEVTGLIDQLVRIRS